MAIPLSFVGFAVALFIPIAALSQPAAKPPTNSPTYDRLGPDAIALGANEGYPRGTRATEGEKRHWVGAFSGRDYLYPHHVIRRSSSPSPLARSTTPFQVQYQFEGGTFGIKDYLARNPVTGFMVLRHGAIQMEHYQYNRNERHRFDSQSMAKTIVAMLVGIAVKEGHIASIDDRAEKYVRELTGTGYGMSSIRDLLQMSSGIKFIEQYKGPDDLTWFSNQTVKQNGPGGAVVLKKFSERSSPAGTKFNYAGAETFALSLVVTAATRMPLAKYLETRIWQPMGAEADATWFIDKSGQETGFCCFNAVLRDYARLALVLMHDGAWNGRQIIPREWVKAATTADRPHLAPGRATKARGYGYQVWILPGSHRRFALIGSFRQLILVDPQNELVMIQTALPPRDNPRAEEPFALFRALSGG